MEPVQWKRDSMVLYSTFAPLSDSEYGSSRGESVSNIDQLTTESKSVNMMLVPMTDVLQN